MAFSKAVQFRGIKNVVKAYENKKVPAWALFQGSQFLEKYEGSETDEGAQLLKDYLSALDQRSNDMNTYTLCVYEDPAGGKINSATKFDASFNFRLVDTIEDHLQSKVGGLYEERLAGIEKTLTDTCRAREPEPPSVKEQMYAALGKLLEHPQIQQVIVGKVLMLVDSLGETVGSIFKRPNQVGAIGTVATTNEVNTDVQTENARLQEAVNILVTVDGKLGTNLLKLAQIAKADPKKYELLISMLNTL